MIVDTHLHVHSSDYDKYPMNEGKTVDEDGSAEYLNTKMAEAGVDKAVIVQPIHYLFDNSYVADTLKNFPGKFAAMGLGQPVRARSSRTPRNAGEGARVQRLADSSVKAGSSIDVGGGRSGCHLGQSS